jgi:hypothetical protein
LVDIVTNATRRAIIGNLRPEGWRNIRRLMIHKKDQYIQLANLTDGNPYQDVAVPYATVIRQFGSGGRSMIAPRFYKD